MSLTQTRLQVLDRLRADLKISGGNVGSYESPLLRRFVDQSWKHHWKGLTDGEAGFGRQRLVVAAPGGPTYDPPADFLSLNELARGRGSALPRWQPEETTWKEIRRLLYDETASSGTDWWGESPGGKYLWETFGTPALQRVRFFPDLEVGEALEFVYITQAPTLANANGGYDDATGNAEDLTIIVDFYDDDLLDSVVSVARSRVVNRADTREYQLALAAAGEVIDTLLSSRAKQDQAGAIPLEAYRTGYSWRI